MSSGSALLLMAGSLRRSRAASGLTWKPPSRRGKRPLLQFRTSLPPWTEVIFANEDDCRPRKAEFSAIVLSELRVRGALGASARISEKCSATREASDDI